MCPVSISTTIMSSSTRSQQASIERLTVGEKLGILPRVVISYAAGLAALFTGLFQGSDHLPPTNYRHFMYTTIRNITDRLSVAQLHLVSPPTDVVYVQMCKKHGLTPNSEVLEDGTQAHWIGPSSAEKVIINFHGGGYVLPSGWAFMEFMYQLQQILSKENKSIAILFLSYDLAPVAKYPRQLQQASALLSHVLRNLQKKPSNIILTGDSAGANLALALLSHIMHPHPSTAIPIAPVSLPSPLRALVLTSPWVSFSTAAPAFSRNAKKDLITQHAGRKWSAAWMGSEPPHAQNADEYSQPIMAGPDWWSALPADEVLIVAGKDEIPVDNIVEFARILEKGVAMGRQAEGKVTLFVADGECHDQTNLDLQMGFKEPGEQAKLIRRWIGSRL